MNMVGDGMTVKELRTLTGLSQSKFAAYFEIPVATLQRWENLSRTPAPYLPKMMERILRFDGMIGESEEKQE